LPGEAAPALVREVRPAGRFYLPGKVYSPGEGRYLARPDDIDPLAASRDLGQTANAALVEIEGGIGVLVLQGKLNVINTQTLELVHRAVAQPLRGLVLWGRGGLFSAGADLKHIAGLCANRDWAGLAAFLRAFQEAIMALRFAPFPVVAALRGLTLGGGAEFSLSVRGRVVGAELRMGLVEARVGLIPGAGGCKEMVRRLGPCIDEVFPILLAGRTSENAHQARQWGFLGGEEPVLLNEETVLVRALEVVAGLAHEYQPPQPAQLQVAGSAGLEGCRRWLADHGDGLSPDDLEVGEALAQVLCGGSGSARTLSEQEVLDLEREQFLRLCGSPATQARIDHMLKTGKPLKN
jgi:3-hydroxyacyl-CoA dehydrogenase